MRIFLSLVKMLSFVLLMVSIFLFSCKKEQTLPTPFNYAYYPLFKGKVMIYDADSIVYPFQFTTDTSHYEVQFQWMEVYDSLFIDNQGDSAYHIFRYTRSDSTQPWIWQNEYYTYLTKTTAERWENNFRFIKLTFPAQLFNSWQGNLFMNTDSPELSYFNGWQYQYTSIDQPATINSITFDSTATVLQLADSTLLNKDYWEEIYAKHVGLIYKREEQLTTQITNSPEFIPQQGFVLKLTLVSHN
jgi:hypothetical protein